MPALSVRNSALDLVAMEVGLREELSISLPCQGQQCAVSRKRWTRHCLSSTLLLSNIRHVMAARSCSCFGTLPLQVCAQECHFSVTANVEAEDRLVFGHVVCAICVCDHSEGLTAVLDDHASQASMYGVGCLGDCQDATVEVSCQEASLTVLAVLEQLADIVSPQGMQWYEGGIPTAQANFCMHCRWLATLHGEARTH